MKDRNPFKIPRGKLLEKATHQSVDGFLARSRLTSRFHQPGFVIYLDQGLDIQQTADKTGGISNPTATMKVFQSIQADNLDEFIPDPVSYTHLTLPTNRE